MCIFTSALINENPFQNNSTAHGKMSYKITKLLDELSNKNVIATFLHLLPLETDGMPGALLPFLRGNARPVTILPLDPFAPFAFRDGLLTLVLLCEDSEELLELYPFGLLLILLMFLIPRVLVEEAEAGEEEEEEEDRLAPAPFVFIIMLLLLLLLILFLLLLFD